MFPVPKVLLGKDGCVGADIVRPKRPFKGCRSYFGNNCGELKRKVSENLEVYSPVIRRFLPYLSSFTAQSGYGTFEPLAARHRI